MTIMATTDVLNGKIPRKSKALLQKMLNGRQITPGGAAYLIAYLDPFHDAPIEDLEGFPDMTACRSDVQVSTRTFAVTSPFDDGITPWDMHVPFMPLTPCFTQEAYFPLARRNKKPDELKKLLVIDGSVDNTIYKKNLRSADKGIRDIIFTKTALMHVPDDENDYFFKVDLNQIISNKEKVDKSLARDNKYDYLPLSPGDKRISIRDPVEVVKSKEQMDLEKGYKARRKMRGVEPETILADYYLRTTMTNSGDVVQSGNGLAVYAGWNILTCAVGDDWQTTTAGDSFDTVSIDEEFTSGAYRLLATGCEVVNTTAELYKGGSMTAFRSPSINTSAEISIPEEETFTARSVGLLPPSTQDEAATYPTSVTWGAEDGSYQVATLNAKDNPYYTPQPGCAALISPSSLTDLQDGTGWLGYFPVFFEATDPVRALCSSLANGLPFDTCGTVYSGLNPNTTMQVTVRYYYERHPTIADPDLLTLSKPSAPYDPLVLEMVSRATRDAPVAVMVKENPLGEWFTDIVGAVANLAPKIGETLSKVGIPFTGEVGRGIGDFAGGIRDMLPAKAANQNALVAASAAEKKVKPRVPVETMQMARKQGAPKAKNVRVGAVGLSKNQRRKLKRKLKGKA
jgi:hypothetical protein